MHNDDQLGAAMEAAHLRDRLATLEGRKEDLSAIIALSEDVKNIAAHVNLLVQTVNQQSAIISHLAAQLIERGIIPEFRQ